MFADGSLDSDSFRRSVECQVGSGVGGIVVAGTTGEVSVLASEEHLRLVRLANEQAKGRILVVAGTGSNSTDEAIELAKCVRKLGVSVTLQVVPYYTKPTQEGLYWHFRRLCEAVDVDIILYNVPSRTGTSLAAGTVRKLSQLPNIVGLKDTRSNATLLHRLIQKTAGKLVVYSGDDITSWGNGFLGGAGVISVMSNLFPALVANLHNCWSRARSAVPTKLVTDYLALCRLMFAETNPIPMKWILRTVGLTGRGIRLPLTTFHRTFRSQLLASIWEAVGLWQVHWDVRDRGKNDGDSPFSFRST